MSCDKGGRGLLLVASAGAVWGLIGPFIKELNALGMGPLQISLLRMALSFVVMLAVTCIARGWRSLALSRRALCWCLLLGAVCQGAYNAAYAACVADAGVAVGAVLLNLSPVFTLGFSAIMLGEAVGGRKLAACVVCVAGCTLVASGGSPDLNAASVCGIAWGVVAGALYALTPVIGKRAMEGADAYAASTYSYLAAAAVLLPAFAVSGEQPAISAQALGISTAFALVPTVGAYLLYYRGLALVDQAGRVPVFASTETMVACALGAVLYSEPMGPASVAGVVLVIVSVVLMAGTPDIRTGSRDSTPTAPKRSTGVRTRSPRTTRGPRSWRATSSATPGSRGKNTAENH
jgi:DME family drug/metabolite transporter